MYRKLVLALYRLPTAGSDLETLIHQLQREAITNLMDDLQAVLNGACPYNPGSRAGEPLGMHHCPVCGCMVIAGVRAHPHNPGCRLGLDPLCHEPASTVRPGEPA